MLPTVKIRFKGCQQSVKISISTGIERIFECPLLETLQILTHLSLEHEAKIDEFNGDHCNWLTFLLFCEPVDSSKLTLSDILEEEAADPIKDAILSMNQILIEPSAEPLANLSPSPDQAKQFTLKVRRRRRRRKS